MKQEFIQDYEEEEQEAMRKFYRDSLAGDFSSCRRYFTDRFLRLNSPISFEITAEEQKPVWTIVPLSGTTILTLVPNPEASFEENHGFAISDIEEIVDYVKEEGRINFVLRQFPTAYKHLDFLEPLLTELRPPVSLLVPITAFFEMKEALKHYIEFDTLSRVRLMPYLRDWSMQEFGSFKAAEAVISDTRRVYAFLKALHYDELVDEIQNSMLLDEQRFDRLLFCCRELIVRPLTRVLEDTYTMSTDLSSAQKRFVESRSLSDRLSAKPRFPGEIGKFLFKRLVHSAPSLNACKQLTYLYEDQDVYKAGKALNEAIVANKPDVVEAESAEVSAILKNIWEDKSLQRRIAGIRGGIPVLFAVVGTIAQGITGTATGLLAGLGFEVADKFLELKSEAISKRIGKYFSPGYEALIYDFKRKYPWTASGHKL